MQSENFEDERFKNINKSKLVLPKIEHRNKIAAKQEVKKCGIPICDEEDKVSPKQIWLV